MDRQAWGAADVTTKARIRTAALHLFAEHGCAATSLRAVARTAGVAPGLVVHHFGGKDGLRQAVDDEVIDILRRTLESIPPSGPAAAVGRARDTAVAQMYAANPVIADYVRRLVVTPGPEEEEFSAKLLQLMVEQTEVLHERGVARRHTSVTEHAVTVLMRQLGDHLLQPTLERLWRLAGEDTQAPTVRVRLTPGGD